MKKNILFFTGGTALQGIASELSNHNDLIMINIITAFDSGGSSAEIRKDFDILAVGDIRNRMISLMNNVDTEVSDLLKYRFSKKRSNDELQIELNKLIDLSHPIIKNIEKKYQELFTDSLKYFNNKKSKKFNLQYGSIGNFIITGHFLKTNNIYKTIETLRELFSIKDEIIPIIEDSLHIAAEDINGSIILKQDKITSTNKEIKRIFILDTNSPIYTSKFNIKKIKNADLIVYPIGSFYTSVLSNFLVQGIDDAIKENKNAKIYIPNTFIDSELKNKALSFQVNEIFKYLNNLNCKSCLNYILIDENHKYPFDLDFENIPKDIVILKKDIIDENSSPKLSPQKTVKILKNLIS